MKHLFVLLFACVCLNSYSQEQIKIIRVDSIKGQTYFCTGIEMSTRIIHKGFPIDFNGAGKKQTLVGIWVTRNMNVKRRRSKREFIFTINQ